MEQQGRGVGVGPQGQDAEVGPQGRAMGWDKGVGQWCRWSRAMGWDNRLEQWSRGTGAGQEGGAMWQVNRVGK
jgi:hypothetical protein